MRLLDPLTLFACGFFGIVLHTPLVKLIICKLCSNRTKLLFTLSNIFTYLLSHFLRKIEDNICMIIRFVVYGIIGWSMEVLWTGIGSLLKKNFLATSTTSIWMFFIYGSAALFAPMIEFIIPLPMFFRGLIYMLCIFIVEYIAGMAMKSAKICPWDYSASKYSVQGVIRLDYAPAWFGAGLVFEFVYLRFFRL